MNDDERKEKIKDLRAQLKVAEELHRGHLCRAGELLSSKERGDNVPDLDARIQQNNNHIRSSRETIDNLIVQIFVLEHP